MGSHRISSHLSLNREGRLGTTDDFATSFLRFPLFSSALWDLPNSRPVHSAMLCCLPTSSSVCLVFFPLSLYLARWFWSDLINGKHDHTTAYRKMDMTRESISCILELREILLSFQTGFNLVNAAVVCAILESISGLKPSSVITDESTQLKKKKKMKKTVCSKRPNLQ